ncbi:nickel pincer cofactor biosynthesis protein LarC [Tenggerimyces flavus]|uniref:Pyridinium-3,5-bisthiocarboxylic acid mononucleotide nickel insertion protein n=1 Tax=Tenggerimyces flavus TaxID=1708749 RepID=A0ABV7YFD6_9ACTN|nr:nickel pincer cofactor biosynthesis protein LarC [Tenggerimyces flavus]MBM7784540.1 uncharacterized protein (TIGR00299 family) protein [Tenggerimyces flavus]
MNERIGWLDCASGASGDMMLGALVDAGVPLAVMQAAVDAVAPEPVRLSAEPVRRNELAATHVRVDGTESHHHRTWTDIAKLLASAPLDEAVRERAHATFLALAEAEAKVHGTTTDRIHFHEVGALDAIADVVGACAGFVHLGLAELHASPVAVGSGFVRAAHGRLPVPVPAVVELFAAAGVPSYAGDVAMELCTPTGAALLVSHVTAWGAQPPMVVSAQGFGAGTKELEGRANALRLLVGTASGAAASELVLETNVDDLDPRIWPAVLARLLAAGAADAWLTPILMKKGRPAHTLSVLVAAPYADAVRRVIFTETSSIGLRSYSVTKEPLARSMRSVRLAGGEVRVKVASYDGAVVNVQPEYDDVLALAEATGQPVKSVLAEASRLAAQEIDEH